MGNILESLNENTSKAMESAEAYSKATLKYLKLKTFEQLASSASFISKFMLLGGLLLIAILFLATSGAIVLGNLLNSMALGCLITGGLFLLIAVVVYSLRGTIDRKVIQRMSKKFFDKNDGNEN